jgi:hypothetical protein
VFMKLEDRGEREDPLAAAILTALAALPPGKSLDPREIAKAVATERARPSDPPDLWRRYLAGVRQQAIHLGRVGRIAVLRKGKPVDPRRPVKGIIRLRLPNVGESLPPTSEDRPL